MKIPAILALLVTTAITPVPAAAIDASELFPQPERIELKKTLTDGETPSTDLSAPPLDSLRAIMRESTAPTATVTSSADEPTANASSPAPADGAAAATGAPMDPDALARILGLDPASGDSLQIVRTVQNPRTGLTTVHGQQLYQGKPVLTGQFAVTLDDDQNLVRLGGELIKDLSLAPTLSDEPAIDAQRAIEIAKEDFTARLPESLAGLDVEISNESVEGVIHAPADASVASEAYQVTFFATVDGEPVEPLYLVDSQTGLILHSHDNLQHADGTGPGGNEKAGRYTYGKDGRAAFPVNEAGTDCTMMTDAIITENLNHAVSGTGTPFQFACSENTIKEINGGYSPLNDAHAFGNIVFAMFKEWYGVDNPFPARAGPLHLMVHFGTEYDNAFFSPRLQAFGFGDGKTKFYPVVSLDVVAHEIAHGFTRAHSGLIYERQSGGINEAFSDMAGEVAELYLARTSGDTGYQPDYEVGATVKKGAGNALRYMHNPELDGVSIDHVDDYNDSFNVHHSSGIYNKAFHVLATTPGWDARTAFDLFLLANTDFWTSRETFVSGASAVVDAATALGHNAQDVRNAFAAVGIMVEPGS